MFADRTNWNLEANPLSEALARHRAAGKPLLNLTISNPTECGFDYDGRAILEALANPASLAYDPDPRGLLSARQAAAAYYAARGAEVPSDSIILTTSTSEAYSFVFRTLCNPGDEILIPEPSYPLFAFLADIQDVKLVGYPLDYDYGWQINFHALQQGINARTRGVIVVHPNNPTGHFTKPHELEKLNEICAARNLAIIADEVFLDFALQAESAIQLCTKFRSPDLHDERPIQNFRPAADESRMACNRRTRTTAGTSSGAPGNHRGHLPLDERAGTVGNSRTA